MVSGGSHTVVRQAAQISVGEGAGAVHACPAPRPTNPASTLPPHLTAKRSPARPPTNRRPPVAPYRQVLPTMDACSAAKVEPARRGGCVRVEGAGQGVGQVLHYWVARWLCQVGRPLEQHGALPPSMPSFRPRRCGWPAYQGAARWSRRRRPCPCQHSRWPRPPGAQPCR